MPICGVSAEMSESGWADNTKHEISFWEGVIRKSAAAGDQRPKPRPVDFAWLRAIIQPTPPPDERIRVLDVGCGPFSGLGVLSPGNPGEVVLTDALGDAYNRLLDEYGFTDFPRVRAIAGEELSAALGINAFHMVHCGNALDHFADPGRAFLEMVAVCKPGGLVRIISIENEGERENYQGLHQWNLKADDDGLWLSSKTSRTNLTKSCGDVGKYEWNYLHRNPARMVFVADIRKKS